MYGYLLKAGINIMKYLYLVTHYLMTPKSKNLFDDIHYLNSFATIF